MSRGHREIYYVQYGVRGQNHPMAVAYMCVSGFRDDDDDDARNAQ